MLHSWLEKRRDDDNYEIIHCRDVDTELGLPEGIARRLLPRIAADLGLRVIREGKATLLLDESD